MIDLVGRAAGQQAVRDQSACVCPERRTHELEFGDQLRRAVVVAARDVRRAGIDAPLVILRLPISGG